MADLPPGYPYLPQLYLPPSATTDQNGAANSIVEGAAVNTQVGITAAATSQLGLAVTYALTADNSGGGFRIDAATGVVTVADPSKIDFESAPGHAYTITVSSNDGLGASSQSFTINVGDVAPTTPVDANGAANSVAEGAAANTQVGITALSSDVNGPGVTWSLSNSANGAFKIDAATGVVSVTDPSKIDFESSGPGHTLGITAVASDGTLTSAQNFTINVTDVALTNPVDTNAVANTIIEGSANGSTVGVTAFAVDPNGPATTYALTGDTSLGGFTINATTGVVTVADTTKIDFESAAGHAYSITVQASNGLQTTSQSFSIGVADAAPTVPVDSNAAANTVVEGVANGSIVGITALSTDVNGPPVTYSLTGDTSGGGFTINATTGVVTVADSTKIDFETAAGHAYAITVQSSDGQGGNSSQSFSIAVTDVAPSTPVDSNAAANTIAEGAAAGSTVGITASSTDINGPGVTWSLTGDTSGGGFTINATTGVITVADSTKIDYETSAGHAYNVTAQASDGTLTGSQVFAIAVADVAPSTPVDSNAVANTIVEGAANGSTVGVTASSTDPNGPAVTYALVGDTSGGGFTINATTGVVTVADATKLDFESSGGSYTVVAQSSDGTLTNSQAFVIAVTDVQPSTPVDSNAAANTVAEGAANGSTVGVTASATDINGPAVTYSLTGDTSLGGFTINAATGVVTIADSTKIDFETAAGHAYTVTAQASDGTLTNSQSFTIAVTDVAPSAPVDSNGGANTVAEGAANGSTVGVTAFSTDINGPAVTYSLVGDTSGGGFTINAATGVVTVADSTKIDYESSPGHAYTVTAQASDGTLTNSQVFTIAVSDVAPSAPVDSDAATNTIAEGPANGSTVGVTAFATDLNGPAVTYALTGDTSGGGFTINATTGVVTIADSTKIDFESSGGSYTVTAQASDGQGGTSSQIFTIAVTDVAPSTPVDGDVATNQVANGAPLGQYVGVTASSTDVNGPAVTYSLIGDTSGGGFTINSATGKVTVADPSKIIFNPASPSFDVTVDSSDGTLHNQQTFTINVIVDTPPVANDDSVSATEKGGLNNAVAGVDPSGNVILGTGAAGSVLDTDVEDASNALTVVAVHTGPEGGSLLTGTVGSPLTGAHGTLTLGSDGAYTYQVNQSDSAVQALHSAAETITDVFNYTIQDTGGLNDTATLTITIHGANDLPQTVADTGTMTEDAAPASFNVISNDTQDPDNTATNAITVGPGGITVTGPAGETFVNSDATASIVGNQIQVSLVNSHFQQLALGEHATVTVPYTLTGDAGETSSANLVVTVDGVNDVPLAVDDTPAAITEDQVGTFTVLGNDTLDADHGAPNNVTTGAISNFSAPSGESLDTGDIGLSVNGSNQVVVTLGSDFQHMKAGETTSFDVAYTLHGDQAGDTSNATLHVTVNGANDAPVAANFTFNGANSAIGNTDLVVNDPADGAPDPAGPQKTISGSLLGSATDVDGPGPLVVVAGTIATANGGTVTMQADGDFTYKPAVGFTGSDSFSYTVSDQNPGVAGTGTGTVTINVATPKVWYVNADAVTDGDGSSENPFNTLSHFNGGGGVDAAGDTIVLETATAHYTGGLTLENNEQLLSQSAGVTINGTTLFAASGANAVLDGGLVLASGNNVQGVDFGTNAGNFAVSGSSVGTVHINDVTSGLINNASGGGISIGGAANVLSIDLASVTTGAGTNGIALTNASGTFHSHGGTISGASGADVSLSGGTLAFTHDGAINDATGTAVSIANMTGGAQDFNGAITGASIALATNTGATMSFDGGTTLTSGASNAFSATGGGTVTVTGTNHLTSTTGTALNITGTTIGAGNVTFHDISSNGGSNDGIILVNTGTAAGNGGLHVTGTGATAGSGGTIANKTGADGSTTQGTGIFLSNTKDVQLNGLQMNDFQNYGIQGTNVTGFTLDHTTVNGTNGTSVGGIGEGDVYFTGLSGSAAVSNSTFTGAAYDAFHVFNDGGQTLNRITITGSTFATNSAAGNASSDGIAFQATGGVFNATVQNSSVTSARSDMMQLNLLGAVSSDLVLTGNTFNNANQNIVSGGGGLTIGGGGPANNITLTYDISNNTIKGALGAALAVFKGTGTNASFVGTISGNTIGTQNVDGSGSSQGDGIAVFLDGAGNSSTTITNNHVSGTVGGIHLLLKNGAAGTMTGVVRGNTIDTLDQTNGFAGMYLQTGSNTVSSGSPDNNKSNLTIGGAGALANHIDLGANASFALVAGIVLEQEGTSRVGLIGSPNYAGGPYDFTAVQNYVDGNNDITATNGQNVFAFGDTNTPVGGGYFGGAQFLIAVPGGVQASSPTAGEMHLNQAELNSVVAAAVAQWAAAGASANQLAMLQATTFSVADLSGNIIGEEKSPAHITIDTDAAGHGWFVDSTPFDNFEFLHALNAAGTDLYTDPSNAAAGHLDLLTTVSHEMGHVLGLDDSTAISDASRLMFINLADGERRLPDATDVALATTAPASGNPGNDIIDAGHGGGALFGGGGADTFVFANVNVNAAPPVTQVMDYHFAEGDKFDFSALTSQFHATGISDNMIVRAVEDASGTFAKLQVDIINPNGMPSAPIWVDVAHIAGAHSGDALNILVDSHSAVHLAQIYVDVLV